MNKKQFLAYHKKIIQAKSKDDLAKIIGGLMHEEHSEPKDALFALAMANKRIFYNLDYFNNCEKKCGS